MVDANAPLVECLAAEPHWPVMGRPGHLSVQESGTASSQETQTLRQCLGVWDSLGLELRGTNAKTMGLQTEPWVLLPLFKVVLYKEKVQILIRPEALLMRLLMNITENSSGFNS